MTYWREDKKKGWDFSLTSGEATSEGKKIPHESRKACPNSPRHGLAGVVKKNSTMSGAAASDGIFFYHNC